MRKQINNINPKNSKKESHGYQQWYYRGKSWYRGNAKNGQAIGYNEVNHFPYSGIGEFGTEINFYIK